MPDEHVRFEAEVLALLWSEKCCTESHQIFVRSVAMQGRWPDTSRGDMGVRRREESREDRLYYGDPLRRGTHRSALDTATGILELVMGY